MEKLKKFERFISSIDENKIILPDDVLRENENLNEASDNNNTKAIKALIKDLENTPYSVGLALLRERLLTHAKNDLKNIEKNPKPWQNPIFDIGMYKDLFKRIIKNLEFKEETKDTKPFYPKPGDELSVE